MGMAFGLGIFLGGCYDLHKIRNPDAASNGPTNSAAQQGTKDVNIQSLPVPPNQPPAQSTIPPQIGGVGNSILAETQTVGIPGWLLVCGAGMILIAPLMLCCLLLSKRSRRRP